MEATKACLLANNHRYLVKAHTKNPSLLAGLLVDEHGEKLIASHAVKKGKRYRYYISRPDRSRRRGRAPADDKTWRLPAAEIEGAVVRLLVRLLDDEAWLLDQLAPGLASLDDRRSVIAMARLLGAELAGQDPIGRRGVMLALVNKVAVAGGMLTINVKLGGFISHAPGAEAAASSRSRPEPQIVEVVEVRERIELRRRNGETRLVIEGDGPVEPEPDPALTKAIGQAHRWWRDLLGGRFRTLREIALTYDTDERYAAWILRLAFLPTDLTEAILAGTQPWDLTLEGLIAHARK